MALADPEGVVTTAPANSAGVAAAMAARQPAVEAPAPTAQDAAPHGMTTEQQIQNWIASRAPGESFEQAVASAPADDRQMHGMVEAGIGTGGYRSYGAAVSLPIGENGRLDLSYREGKNDYWLTPGYFYPRYGFGAYRGVDSLSRSMSVGFNWSKDAVRD
ncbi:MAG: hypothetical protein J0J08_14835 [Brevundimonas sp.]|nr:hypothetical protein [Brevundimonas sp.]